MKISPRSVLSVAAGVAVGNMVAERFVLRAGDDDPTGFITVSPGFGLDEIARATLSLVAIGAIDRALKGVI